MQRQIWKRLVKVEDSFCPNESKNGVVFFIRKDESIEEFNTRISRWKAGEKVAGMDRNHTRGERIGIVQYVKCDRRIDAS